MGETMETTAKPEARKPIQITMRPSVCAKVDRECEKLGQSRSTWLERAAEEKLARKGKP